MGRRIHKDVGKDNHGRDSNCTRWRSYTMADVSALPWHLKCCCHMELWNIMISFPFVKDGPVSPMLKDIRKEAPKHLSLTFRESDQLLSRLPLTVDTPGSFHSVRNLHKQKRLSYFMLQCYLCLKKLTLLVIIGKAKYKFYFRVDLPFLVGVFRLMN